MVEDATYELENQLLAKYRTELTAARADAAEASARVQRYELGITGLMAVIAERQNGVEDGAEAARDEPTDADDRSGAAPSTEGEPESSPEAQVEAEAPKGPRGEDAVRRVMMERPGHPFSPKDLADALRERGWFKQGTKHPTESARAAANRLRYKDDEPFAYQNGKYIYVPNDTDSAAGPSLDLFVPGSTEA